MKILITGATGFVGYHLTPVLHDDGHDIVACGRATVSPFPPDIAYATTGSVDDHTDWSHLMQGVDAVIHLAARTHILKKEKKYATRLYKEINVDGSRRLAEQAAAAGVKRFILISSIKVNGNGRDTPYTEADEPAPEDEYGRTKWQAEQALRGIAAKNGMKLVILRPPLLYGGNAKGNLKLLALAIKWGLPLPLASIANRRTLLHVDHLCEAVRLCLSASIASPQTYLIGDRPALSTPAIVRIMARQMDKTPLLLPFPPRWLERLCSLIGKKSIARRLLGSLEVDSTRLRRDLGWNPRPLTSEQEKS